MSGTVDDPRMPNGDCDCASIPLRHLDDNGHVPTCGNWTWSMLWQERLAHNLTIAAALRRAFELAEDNLAHRACYPGCRYQWQPGCGRPAP